jgi:GntR family transcriptional regulator
MPGNTQANNPTDPLIAELGLERSASTPLYLQLRNGFARLIREGRLLQDESLPSERAIAESLGVSRVTARKAIDLLVEDGLVIRRQGLGNFIAQSVDTPPTHSTNLIESSGDRGLISGARWIRRSLGAASPQEMVVLGLSPGTRVARLERLRLADETPVAYEATTVPASILPNPDVLKGSLYDYFAEQGTMPVRALQHIRAANASARHAKLLSIPAGQALLCVTRVSYLDDGRAVETTDAWCRSDYYDFVFELRR